MWGKEIIAHLLNPFLKLIGLGGQLNSLWKVQALTCSGSSSDRIKSLIILNKA
jgi:hypothetical protein